MKFGLENIEALCGALDRPERSFRSIIVAGTNGKGSVTAMVHQALVAAGHRAGRYTSPHLQRIEERFVVGSREVSTAELEEAAREVRAAVERLQRDGFLSAPPTFFECATAAAFVLFRQAAVDPAVLEVGLGGRLDATNVVTPIAAAITSIDFDHQAQLGDTLEAIAYEKAGVIKPGIPVVVGAMPAAAEAVIAQACARRSAALIRASDCVRLEALAPAEALALPGEHQRGNAAVAACLLRQLPGLGLRVPDAAIRAGLSGVRWPGRLEQLEYGNAKVLIDAAHNAAGARALAAYLRRSAWQGSALIFGVMQDKDVGAMLAELAPVSGPLVCTTPDTSRAMPAESVAAVARALPLAFPDVSVVADPRAALERTAAAHPRVVIAGSIFLIGPLRGILRPR
jgi:dihydrofolate synthase/folylpolyglutamate synthase